MKIGLSSYTYAWAVGIKDFMPSSPLNVLDLLGKAVELQVDILQIADNIPLSLLEKNLNELKNLADKGNITIELGTKGLNPSNIRKYIDIAKVLSCHTLRTLPHDKDAPTHQEALLNIREIETELFSDKITLVLENHDYYPAAWILKLINEVNNPYVKICMDAVNNLGQGESFYEVYNCFKGNIANFHCKDYTIKRKKSMLGFDIIGTPVGEGMLPLDLLKEELHVPWIIELWTPWQGDIETTVSMEEIWAKKSVEALKSLRKGSLL